MKTNVRALQRRLLLVSGGVAAAVGVAGLLLWRNYQEAARKLLVAQTRRIEGGDGGGSDAVVVKRVLVRRRVGAGPEEMGEVLEEHVISRRSIGAVESVSDITRPRASSGGVRDLAQQLSMGQKVAIFGSLVAAFVGFNAWAIPKMRRTFLGAAKGTNLFPKEALELVPQKRLFVDLACGDGERLLEAAHVFEEVIGFEPHGLTSWRARKRCAEVAKVRVAHLRRFDMAAGDLARADLVYCSSAAVAADALPAMKSGGAIFTREEVYDVSLVWSGENAKLYRKD